MTDQRCRTAVLTDAVSDQFYFPAWYKYYSSQFGGPNLFVVTYGGMREAFKQYDLGGVWETQVYNNESRVKLVAGLVNALLTQYQFVIRVDTDEILCADPRVFQSLKTYMDVLERPFVTAEGYDIVPKIDDIPLDFSRPILGDQRTVAYPYDALNKTCITSMATVWAPGFHFCSWFPSFHQLYLLHLKRADLDIQLQIGEAVAERAPGERNRDYYLTKRDTLAAYNNAVLRFPGDEGWDWFTRNDYRKAFLQGIKYTKTYGGVYHGAAFRPDNALVTIPREFYGKF